MLCNSIGLPPTQRNCFNSFAPVREPLPAATRMTPTSREAGGERREAVDELSECCASISRSLSLPPSRLPPPALPMKQLPEEIADGSDADDLDSPRGAFGNSTLRHVGDRHPHLCRFPEAALCL